MNPLPAVSLLLVTAAMEICVFNEEKSLTSAHCEILQNML